MNIYTHTPDGNETDANVLPEGTLGIRSNQIIIGNGTSTMAQLEPVAGNDYIAIVKQTDFKQVFLMMGA